MDVCQVSSAFTLPDGQASATSGSGCSTAHSGSRKRPPATICFPFAGGIMGGSHISALKLIRALDPQEFRPIIVLHDDKGQFADFLRSEGIDFVRAPTPWHVAPSTRMESLRIALGAPAGATTLARYLRRQKVDIVHSNEGPMHVTWGPAAWLAGKKLLWHHRSSPRAKGLRYLAPLIADRVVSVSRFAAPKRGFLTAASKCSVVHSPFDTDPPLADRKTSRQTALDELGVPPETPLLGYFGNLVHRKRPVVFVETIAAINRRRPERPVAGLLFGSTLEPGLDKAVAARAEELGIADHIRLMGFRHPSTGWMAACDTLVVPAIDEPFGRTLIEAMLLRTPVVAAASGGNIEAIRHGENGLLAEPDNAESLADAILRILDDPAYANHIAEFAYHEAISRFGIDRHCAAITQIYRQLLGHGS